jgi:hypothetical protein
MRKLDEMWQDLLEFKYRGMLTMKNLDNKLPTESWDSMYHTGLYLAMAALRLKRKKDENTRKEIENTLQVILDNGVIFRGFNSKGEYWVGHAMKKYKPLWEDKDIFWDTSRDQVLSLNFGLYFLEYAVDKAAYPKIHQLKLKIVEELVSIFEKGNYNLQTTYGDCTGFEIPFRLVYHKILDSAPLPSLKERKKSMWYYRIVPTVTSWTNMRYSYFNYEMVAMILFLLIKCYSDNYPASFLKKVKSGYRKFTKSRIKDNNLFFELLYYSATGEMLKERKFQKELDEIFEKTPDPKIQDFIWQRSPLDRYKPEEPDDEKKNFYAPFHDYLIAFELLQDLKI